MKIKSTICILVLVCISRSVIAQELFVYSEPASNMATKSIGLRANNYFTKQAGKDRYNYFFYPEVMIGVSKKLMLHSEFFFNNQNQKFGFTGASVYGKYRFYSNDGVHNHFRMAAYAKAAVNNSPITQPAIDLVGYNSGFEGGVVATRLINKLAISAGTSFVHAIDNTHGHSFKPEGYGSNAVSYNLAFGQLILPREYTSYQQTNVNLMVEFLGQSNFVAHKSYLDLAPSLQFIILSRMRADVGYRWPLINNLSRSSDRGFLLRLEYNIFNAYK